jgi:hypothetical protein
LHWLTRGGGQRRFDLDRVIGSRLVVASAGLIVTG